MFRYCLILLTTVLFLIGTLNTVAAQTETASVEAGTAATAETDAAETETDETDSAYTMNWSGFYAGLSLSANKLEANWTTTEARDPDGFEQFFISEPDATLDSSETEPGLFLGYNWQLGRVVLGVEVYSQFFEHEASIEDRIPGLSDPESDPQSFVVVRAESNDSFDLRLRGGFLIIPRLLVYGTAGRTSMEVEATSICPGDVNVCNPFFEVNAISTARATMSTTVLGLGAEYAFDSLRLRLEYQYADFGDFAFTAMQENSFLNLGADAVLSVESQTLQLGATYEY